MYQMALPFAVLIQVDRDAAAALYLQIAKAMVQAIHNGQLQRGARLPGVRVMAEALHVHRKTMQMALDELDAQGWIDVLPRKGCFVVRETPEFRPSSLVALSQPVKYPETTAFSLEMNPLSGFPMSDFQHSNQLVLMEGFPDIRLSPLDELMREFRSLEKKGTFRKYFHYGNPQGTTMLRETLAAYLSETRGLPISPDNILITRGAQQGLYIAAQALLQKGDGVVVGDPGYRTATLTFERTGAVIHRIPVDDFGICVQDIEALCQHTSIRMVYAISHHHHPTTVTLSPERRLKLLELAARYGFAIVEDDYDYDFHYNSSPMLPIASLDQQGSVIYVGTLSKTLAPAIRIGFLVAPQNFIREAVMIRRSMDFQGDSMLEMAIAGLYRNGVMANYLKKVVKIYRQRRDTFCQLLTEHFGEAVSFKVPDGGMSVWTTFHGIDLPILAERAATQGVFISDGRLYDTVRNQNATRLGFSGLDEGEQERAIAVLRGSIG